MRQQSLIVYFVGTLTLILLSSFAVFATNNYKCTSGDEVISNDLVVKETLRSEPEIFIKESNLNLLPASYLGELFAKGCYGTSENNLFNKNLPWHEYMQFLPAWTLVDDDSFTLFEIL